MTRRSLAAGIAVASVAIGLGAQAVVSRAPRDGPPDAGVSRVAPAREFWAAYREASALRARGDFDGAIVLYARALGLRPDHEDSLYYLGNCQLERRAYAEAIRAYRELVQVNPEGSSRGYMQWALVHASIEPDAPRDLTEAQRLFQRALAVDSDSGAMLGLGEIAILRGRRDEARLWLERAGADNAMSMAAPYLLGYLAAQAGARDEAWRQFRIAVGRADVPKPAVKWTEEGDVKTDPALRWRALARQSVFGTHWIRLRAYVEPPGPTPADMEREYRQLDAAIAAAVTP